MTTKRDHRTNRLSRDALARYPISPGGVVHAKHGTVSCFDLERDLAAIIRTHLARPVSLLYVDPPWGPANASAFRTKADLTDRATYPNIVANLSALIAATNAPAVIEMGNKWTALWISALSNAGVTVTATVPGTYYNKHPMTYLIVTPGIIATRISDALMNLDDDHAPGAVMDTLGLPPGSIVFDPACGRGLTAIHARARNLTFTGNELAPYRAAATIQELQDD